jgi:DNA-binding NtrC family response regulator
MATKAKSMNEDWPFFEAVARAAFANPFGKTRDDLDVLIAGTGPGVSGEELINAVIARIEERIAGMRRVGKADLRRHGEGRRQVLKWVFLFSVFHRHAGNFDRLIQLQLKNGGTPCRVAFAEAALNDLRGFGFGEEEALRFFALFYQLRRAYYFIRNGLVGNSASMRALRKHLWDCVFTHDVRWFESRLWDRMEDFSVLLLGETGTGKGSAAAAIGRSGFIPFDPVRNCFSESFTRNFVAINLSQFSEGLLESELFGHKKGAFTGAMDNHDGLFNRCLPHGVIFLDEIGDIGIPVQIKLLQVLQERVFSPVGSHEAKRFSGRVVAATNRPLDELRADGKFRDDLYYRLCTEVITVPPLRKRLQEDPEEMDNLLASILSRLAGGASDRERQIIKKILKRDVGDDYAWPGNVRELEQAVKRIILTGRYQGMKVENKNRSAEDCLSIGIKDGTLTAEELMTRYCTALYRRFGTYEEVSRITRLDRRTVKKYIGKGQDLSE